MILHGNQRGGAKNLALHLLKTENEHVDVHELRGFVSDDLVAALNEIHAVSRGTRARQFLYSLSLNPPPSENVSTQVFRDTIERVEQKLGLTGQPRAIVFHEKKGRRHCHAVWSRIDAQAMKAIPLPHTKRKLMDISRALYLEHGWKMPRGMMASEERDLRNFTLAQWQQAKRRGKNPRAIKAVFQDCWAVSDSQAAFQQALKERGYTLARGDRRGFVALDHTCEVYAVAKWVGIRAKEVRAKLTDQDALPSVAEARVQIADTIAARLQALQVQQDSAIKRRLSDIEETRLHMARRHAALRKALGDKQQARWQTETKVRQERYHKGLRGLLDRLTGYHRRVKKQNEEETVRARLRDIAEKDSLVFEQLEQRRALQARIQRLERFPEKSREGLSRDLDQYRDIHDRKREVFDRKTHMQSNRALGKPAYER